MMLERLLLVAVLAALGVGLYWWQTRRQLRRVEAGQETDPLLAALRHDVPTIVYFTTPGCIPCKTQQQPALHRLRAILGDDVQIVQVDAAEQPEAASRWGVMSAPTTFVLGAQRQPLAVNHGTADEHKLLRQLGFDAEKAA